MSTIMRRMRQATLVGVLTAIAMVCAPVSFSFADVTSDESGAILIFPKIVVDTAGVFGPPTDTEIQITNTSNSPVSLRCYMIDATSTCSNDPSTACREADEADPNIPNRCFPGGSCEQQWSRNDFRMTLTKRQPIAWQASEGMNNFPCDGISAFCPFGQTNVGSDGAPSNIPPVQRDPFYGSIKCVQVHINDFQPTIGMNPGNRGAGDLKGEATIVSADGNGLIDSRKSNAVALQSTGVNDNDDVLLIGGQGAEYSGCPNTLVLNHVFDNASVMTHNGSIPPASVTTDLTLVPCGDDFLQDTPQDSTMQFLVFNEFEQRFSASTNFTCWHQTQLSDIDTPPGSQSNYSSVFNVGVQGTISGQTRIRPLSGPTGGNTLIAVAEEFWSCTSGPDGRCSTAYNVHTDGTRALGDEIILSPSLP